MKVWEQNKEEMAERRKHQNEAVQVNCTNGGSCVGGNSVHLRRISYSTGSQKWCFVSVAVLSVTCALLFGVQMAEARYPEQFLESVEVCSASSFGTFGALAKKKIRLQNFPNNTVSVKITRWEDLYASFFNFKCKFQVVAPKNMGVMVVIQSLKLRTRRSRDFSCRDYVQFQQDDGYKTSQICGTVDESDVSKVPDKIIGPRKFYDPKGEMDVSFFTDVRDKKDDDDEYEERIGLHLVFTAYRECVPTLVSSNLVRPCSSLRSHSCVSSSLFCDGVINCGFNDEEFGADERDCGGKLSRGDIDSEVHRTISIYVFAITTIATLVIVVIFSLIVCCCMRKFAKKHSRNGDRHSFAQGENPLPPHLHGMHRQHHQPGAPDIIRMDVTGPSAPLRSHEPTPEKYPVVDVDQPPPYDALFPTKQSMSNKPSKK